MLTVFDDCEYIWLTCDKYIKKKKIPCQAVCNKLEIYQSPIEINDIRKLEKVIISKRILFKKIVIMSKGQAPKLKGWRIIKSLFCITLRFFWFGTKFSFGETRKC